MQRAVVLLSGGLDSTTVAAVAKRDGNEIYALTVDYNQRHRVEIESAKKVAVALGVKKHVIMPLDLRLFGGSALTDDWSVAKNVPVEHIGTQIPNTYVPARNTILLSLALAFAETVAANSIYIGVSGVDYSGYPDCRPEFLDAFTVLSRLATKSGVEGLPLTIHSPLISLGKRETIELGLSLGVDYSLTWTCYDPQPDNLSCGQCESCLLRLQAFNQLGIADPLRYYDGQGSRVCNNLVGTL
ncbi:7-cyano-7-deazaguanine synthase [Planctomycetales bacterium]|nr:7-cyano-7-deazaguanine synthase [Planctomycetales bacterium]